MKIFCITTGKPERIKSITDQVNFTFDFYYSKPVDVCISEIGINSKKAKYWRLKGLNPTEVACFHSHITLWEMCVKNNEPFFIFEDNIQVVNDIQLNFIEECSSYGFVSFAQRKQYNLITPHYKKNFYSRAYVISPCAARKLLDSVKKEPIYMPVDNFMSEWPLHKVRGYCSPNIYFSRKGRDNLKSLVGNDVPSRERYSWLNVIHPFFLYVRVLRVISRALLYKHII